MSPLSAYTVPKWGMTMEEGTLTEWLAAEGQEVSPGDVLASMESSKISGEIESEVSGVLARQVVKAGETVPVGSLIAVVADPGTDEAEIDAFVARHSAGAGSATAADPQAEPNSAATAQPAADRGAETPNVAAAGGRPDAVGEPARNAKPDQPKPQTEIPDSLRGFEDGPASEHARDLAQAHDIRLSAIAATGRGNRVTVNDLREAVEAQGGSLEFGNTLPRRDIVECRGDDSAVPATVYARERAQELEVNLLNCRPTGRGGQVTLADVEAASARLRPQASQAAAQHQAAEQAQATAAGRQSTSNTVTDVPMSNMRKVIAQRLQSSYLSSPHFRVSATARIDELLALRTQINENRRDLKVSINDMVIAAVGRALTAVPELNAQYDEQSATIRQFAHADISVAVATAEGLITPIIERADTRTLSDISAAMHDLSTRAKAGQLKPDEFQGGTFSISNLGMFGVDSFDAIINPPQVGIIAVGGARSTFVPDEHGEPKAATVLSFTVSADHRVIDGATNAAFAAELKRLLEHPGLIVV